MHVNFSDYFYQALSMKQQGYTVSAHFPEQARKYHPKQKRLISRADIIQPQPVSLCM